MPQSALSHVPIDYCVPASQIGVLLQELAAGTAVGTVIASGAHDQRLAHEELRELT